MGRRVEKTKETNCGNVNSPEKVFDRHQKDKIELIKVFLITLQHYFGNIYSLFSGVEDYRNPNRITYGIPSLSFAGFLMFVFHLGARRLISEFLRKNTPFQRNLRSIEKYKALFNLDSVPHGDTLNVVFSKLDPNQYQEIVTRMVNCLIRSKIPLEKKVFYPYRLLDRYFVIVIDGTGMLKFNKRHCSHCLTAKHNGKTIYYHKVLEAKLITYNGFALSIMTEFIENSGKDLKKQDCELKAFYRLAERLKKRFPRLSILLSLDGLYAGGPSFELCEKYDWKYMIVLKDKDLRDVNIEFENLSKLQTENRYIQHPGLSVQIRMEMKK